MMRIFSFLGGITGRITTRLVVIVSVSILITAALGYVKLSEVTTKNASIRIDRAARAAAALFTEHLSSEFLAIRDRDGRPLAIRLKAETAHTSLSFRDAHDALLKEIGLTNQGAANLFRLNPQTRAFDRFATTFRKPDGSMPPPMSIGKGHPAYDDLINNRPHMGEVPVMGRQRLAYLTPIQDAGGAISGALAVDVGWVDDLNVARNELRTQIAITASLILVLVIAFGTVNMSGELKPLRVLAQYADELAVEARAEDAVPYKDRTDEVGALAQGLERIVILQGRLARLAYTDDLTGLGNRSRYLDNLEACLKDSLSGGQGWALLHIDIDNFKHINDAYGQTAGDTLLKTVAAQIRKIAGDGAHIARMSADNFTMLVRRDVPVAQISELARNLLNALRQSYQVPASNIHLTGSIGIVLLDHDVKDADEAHRNAGLALRKAKADGGDQAVFFSSDLNDDFQDNIRMERMLRTAIDEREIDIHFQPQIIPSTNALAGIEALARWTHPAEGPIPPGKFIAIAEASGQIVDLGTLILDLACAQAAKWRAKKFDFKHISVNVSPMQLWQSNFVDIVKAALDRHGVAGKDLCIEITEGVFVDHSEQRIMKVLVELRALGVSLALDDFGSGYSSLGYLNRLPFDQLKIDRAFISDIDSDLRKQKVLRGILELGRGLGFNIVVEGAETREEVAVVEKMGCDAVQGYFFARPTPALLIPDMVRKIARSKPETKAFSA